MNNMKGVETPPAAKLRWMYERMSLIREFEDRLKWLDESGRRRTGPGVALDGEPKFDLTQFDPEYFDRLRSRVSAALDCGIYVSIMLFMDGPLERSPIC
jgi:hypothetical protein